jgi:hypothetical protein
MQNAGKSADTSTEELRLENDILKLKMMAEMGAVFCGSNEHVPPEIERQFLENVIAIERETPELISLYEQIGKPSFFGERDLDDESVDHELERLNRIMENNGIELTVLARYDHRTLYKFITEELFKHQTHRLNIPGMRQVFVYEEFHPNHEYDIHGKTLEFLKSWFTKRFADLDWEFSTNFLLADGRVMNKEEVVQRLADTFGHYRKYENCSYCINDISVQLNESSESGLAYSEGRIRYDALLEDGSVKHVEGPFKIYLSMEHQWWEIFYFVVPEFDWG